MVPETRCACQPRRQQECSDRYRQGWGCTGGSTMTQHMRSRRCGHPDGAVEWERSVPGSVARPVQRKFGTGVVSPCGGLSEQCGGQRMRRGPGRFYQGLLPSICCCDRKGDMCLDRRKRKKHMVKEMHCNRSAWKHESLLPTSWQARDLGSSWKRSVHRRSVITSLPVSRPCLQGTCSVLAP